MTTIHTRDGRIRRKLLSLHLVQRIESFGRSFCSECFSDLDEEDVGEGEDAEEGGAEVEVAVAGEEVDVDAIGDDGTMMTTTGETDAIEDAEVVAIATTGEGHTAMTEEEAEILLTMATDTIHVLQGLRENTLPHHPLNLSNQKKLNTSKFWKLFQKCSFQQEANPSC